jgi:Tfp pilus assembly protein PilF
VAAALVNKGQYAAAIPAWQKALDMQPDDAGVHFNFGETLMRAGQIEDGISHTSRAILTGEIHGGPIKPHLKGFQS